MEKLLIESSQYSRGQCTRKSSSTFSVEPSQDSFACYRRAFGTSSGKCRKSTRRKKSYDKRSKDLPILKEGDVVRIQGEKGFSKKGVILEKAGHPRSYQVKKLEWCIQKKSKTSFQSRRAGRGPSRRPDDIPMEEPQQQGALPLEYNEDSTMTMTKSPERLIYTRSGRLVKKPDRLNL